MICRRKGNDKLAINVKLNNIKPHWNVEQDDEQGYGFEPRAWERLRMFCVEEIQSIVLLRQKIILSLSL